MGWIYCIENKHNGHKYVGQTKRNNVQERWNEHIEMWKNGTHNIKMQAAYNKYGLDGFKFYVLEEIKDISVINDRELYYQQALDVFNNGYNIMVGAWQEKKRVYCYDFEGNYLNKSFSSVMETVKQLEIDESLVFNICNGTRYKKSASGKDGQIYRFSYELKEKLPPIEYQRFTKHILQYDKQGNIIKEWNSIADAAEYYSGNRRNTTLHKYFAGQRKHAFGYQWEKL